MFDVDRGPVVGDAGIGQEGRNNFQKPCSVVAVKIGKYAAIAASRTVAVNVTFAPPSPSSRQSNLGRCCRSSH
jgi:hypothetical protein